MNEPPKTLTQAVDDLRLIRQVLDQTATSFRTLAPEFFRMGVVWVVYGVLSCLVLWPDTLAFLFPEAFSGWDPTTGLPRVLSALLPWARVALWGYLLVQCILWQRKKGTFPALGGKVLGIWQVLLVLYLLLVLLLEGGFQYHSALPMSSEPTSFAWDHAWALFYYSRLFLPILFPGIPLVVTGILLSERPLFVLGLVVSALAVCSAFGPGLVPVLATILPLYAFLVGVGLVQVFYQPVALLVLARRLRRRPEGV